MIGCFEVTKRIKVTNNAARAPVIIDLNSQDSTINIIKKLELDYKCIKLVEYGKNKDIIKSEGIT